MIVKLLTVHHLEFLLFKGGFTGLSESTLVKLPHCSKSLITAQLYCFQFLPSMPNTTIKEYLWTGIYGPNLSSLACL